jgi:hypothetical protein
LVREIRHVLAARNDDNLFRLEDRSDAIDGVLEHGAVSNQLQ